MIPFFSAYFTLVVTEDGVMCAWGRGSNGQLGLKSGEHQLLLARLGGRESFDAPMVLVAAGLLRSGCGGRWIDFHLG